MSAEISGTVCVLVGCLTSRPRNMLVYLRDGSAKTIVRAATLRYKLQIKLSTSPSHSILTPGRPVPALTLKRQAPGRVATGVLIFESLVWLEPEKIPAQVGFEPGIFRSQGGRLTTRPTRRSLRDRSAQTVAHAADLTTEAVYQPRYLTQSQWTDSRPTSPSTDPIAPGAWHGRHHNTDFEVTGMSWLGAGGGGGEGEWGLIPCPLLLRGWGALNHHVTEAILTLRKDIDWWKLTHQQHTHS